MKGIKHNVLALLLGAGLAASCHLAAAAKPMDINGQTLQHSRRPLMESASSVPKLSSSFASIMAHSSQSTS